MYFLTGTVVEIFFILGGLDALDSKLPIAFASLRMKCGMDLQRTMRMVRVRVWDFYIYVVIYFFC